MAVTTNTNIIKTRILNRYDEFAAWGGDNVELLKGEIALVKVDTQQIDANGKIVNVPAILMKVGDVYPVGHAKAGQPKAFGDLPWLSAKAADVYGWAKTQHSKDIPITITEKDSEGNDVTISDVTLGAWLENLNNSNITNNAGISAIQAKLTGIDDTVVATLTAAINALDHSDNLTALNKTAGADGLIVSGVSQENGAVTVTYKTLAEADIPKISAANIVVTPKSSTEEEVTAADKFVELGGEITTLRSTLAGGVHFVGVTTTELTDGCTTNSLTIKAENNTTITYTPLVKGDIVLYKKNSTSDEKEFIWTGSVWEELGDVSRIGAIETLVSGLESIKQEELTDSTDTTSDKATKFVTHITKNSSTNKYEVKTGRITVTDISKADNKDLGTYLTETVDAHISAVNAKLAGLAEGNSVVDEIEDKLSDLKLETDPAASGESLEFVTSVLQENGQIAVTRKNVAAATNSTAGVVKLGATGGAASYDVVNTLVETTIPGLSGRVSAVENNYMRIGTDNKLYAGKDGTEVIIFDCGGASV